MREDRFITIGVGATVVCLLFLATFTDKLEAGWRGADISKPVKRDQSTGISSNAYSGDSHLVRVPIIENNGVFAAPIRINGGPIYSFIIDSGASDVSVPPEIVEALIKSGRLVDEDFIGDAVYTLADGSQIQSKTFVLRKVMVGGIEIKDVRASVAVSGAPPLLGQSFLTRLKRWHIDNSTGTLDLEI